MGFSDNPKVVKLSDFGWTMRERFLYEYDFGDNWQHQIRVEAILTPFWFGDSLSPSSATRLSC
jgi:hypothetical protein